VLNGAWALRYRADDPTKGGTQMADNSDASAKHDASEDLVGLKDRALSASSEGITIADARLPDQPLIYVNAGFERLTGYSRDEVLGRNCRFLQGAGTDAETVVEIRKAIHDARECTVEILNYRKDGTPFWNRLAITPVKDVSGVVTHFIGIQSDVSKRRRAEDELRRAKLELESALSELRRDLELAAQVQQSFLPKRSPELAGLKAAWEFHPCAHLAGDIFNVFALDDDHAALYVLDVSGHGASSALLSVTLSRLLSQTRSESTLFLPDGSIDAFRIARPSEVARRLNDRFPIDEGIAQYFTLIYGILDVRSKRFDYVAAGHPGPIVVSSVGKARTQGSTATPIGLLPSSSFAEASLSLAPGDRIYLFTDGVTDAANHQGEPFGLDRLGEVLEASRGEPLERTLDKVVETIWDWQGGKSSADDISLLATEVW
jgi:PAS domain S-box-containing protein